VNKVVYSNLGANSSDRNMYIRSTDIENANWISLLASFPDEALYFMTKGKKVVIIDKSSKKVGKVQKIFCPIMSDFLKYLRREEPQNKRLKYHMERALHAYHTQNFLKRKYQFFRKRLKTTEVVGRTIKCKGEPTIW